MRILIVIVAALIIQSGLSGPALSVDSAIERVNAALSSPDRLQRDKVRDADRKPAEVLAFLGVAPGIRVFDLLSGGGYYSELLAHAVGPVGRVVQHNNAAYIPFAKDELAERFQNGRLTQVERVITEIPDLDLGENTYDMILFSLGYHDLYFEDDNWPSIDRHKLLTTLFRGLKPDGVIGIIDHKALPGAPPGQSGQDLHRIDPTVVVKEMEAVGFVLDGEADILANPKDDKTISVFATSIRGRTDRFLMRFKKPKY